jgi:microcystin-dependent protein
MATLVIPHAFVAGTPALASEVNANFQAVVSWTQGQISTDNLGILGARSVALPSSPTLAILSLAQTSSNIALNISNTGTESSLAISQSGALASGKAAILVNSPSTQTVSGAAEFLMTLATNSTIPAILVEHGANTTASLTKTQFNLFNSTIEIDQTRIKLPIRTTVQRNAIIQEGSILYNTTEKRVQYRDNIEWRDFTPAGVIQMYAGAAAPTGWLLCQGQEVSQLTYATLYGIISTTYNTGGEAVGNFRLPDFRRRVPVGAGGTGSATLGNLIGNHGGSETHTLIVSEMPAHTHVVGSTDATKYVSMASTTFTSPPNAAFQTGGPAQFQYYTTTSPLQANSVGGDLPHNNIQPSLVVNYIIKT